MPEIEGPKKNRLCSFEIFRLALHSPRHLHVTKRLSGINRSI